MMPEWIRPHKDAPSVGGWLAIIFVLALALWRGTEMVDVLSFFAQIWPPVVRFFLEGPFGIWVALAVGVALIAYSNKHYGGSVTKPEPRGERAKRLRDNDRLAQHLHSMISSDSSLNIALLNDEMHVDWSDIRLVGDPRITFRIPLVNASLRMLKKGELVVAGQVSYVVGDNWQPLLPPTASLRNNNNQSHITRGERGLLEIQQRLLPEVVTNIRNRAGKEASFSFGQVTVSISTRYPKGIPTQEDSAWEVRLSSERWNGEWKATIPSNLSGN